MTDFSLRLEGIRFLNTNIEIKYAFRSIHARDKFLLQELASGHEELELAEEPNPDQQKWSFIMTDQKTPK